METEILDIIRSQRTFSHMAEDIDTLTKEHYMKFIEWLFSKDSKYAVGYGSKTPLSTTYNDYTIEQVYQFWLDNICK
jgi:hypothetical protein